MDRGDAKRFVEALESFIEAVIDAKDPHSDIHEAVRLNAIREDFTQAVLLAAVHAKP